MSMTSIENVSETAFAVAHWRAVESQRPDALFRDPLAERLAGNRGKNAARMMPMPTMVQWNVVVRTAIIDHYVCSAIAQGIDAVLNLGAGLDTRPYRLDLPGSLRWLEVDYPRMVEFKEQLLAEEKPRCRVERIKVDLDDAAERRQMLSLANGSASKMLVLTEGVISYLTAEQVGSLADDLNGLNHVWRWIVEYYSPDMIRYRQRRGLQRKMRNAPFKFVPKGEDWLTFFAAHGWRPSEIRYLTEEGERLHRPIHLPFLPKLAVHVRRFLSARERRADLRRLAGYALIESCCD